MSYKRISPIPVIEGGTGDLTLTNHGLLVGAGTSAITQLSVAASGTVLIGNSSADPSFSATPTVTSITISNSPVSGSDGANKSYVDTIAAGFEFKSACLVGTTANLNATYLNGVAGVGATLVNAGTLAAFTVDGQTPAINSRVLVKDQSSQLQNGIYTLTTVGSGAVAWVLTRSTDYNQPSEIQPGDIVPVTTGTVNADTLWLQNATVTTVGTDSIVFVKFLGQGITTITGNSGGALTGSNITFTGGTTGLTFAGSGTTETLSGTLVVANGGTGASTLTGVLIGSGTSAVTGNAVTNHNVLVGGTSNAITSVAPSATSGIPLVSGGSSADPSFTTAVVAGGGTGATTFTAHGVLLGNTTSAINVTAVGTTGQVLTGSTGADPVWASPAASSISITGDSGGALTGNAFTITGGSTGLTFAGSGSTETLGGTLVVSNGGTGAATLTSHGVLLGNGTSAVTATAAGTTGQVLTGVTGSAPTFQTPAAAGALNLISTQTASSSSSLTWTSGLTYNNYLLTYYNATNTAGSGSIDLVLQLSTNGGSTYIATGYVQSGAVSTSGLAVLNWGGASDSSNGNTYIYNVNSGVGLTSSFNTFSNYTSSSAFGSVEQNSVYSTAATTSNAFKLVSTDAHAFSGVFSLYGYST